MTRIGAERSESPVDDDACSENALLDVRDVTKVFHSQTASTAACDNVGFYVRRGESLALVGESGSGKSTVARIICGLEQADSGGVLLDGDRVVGAKPPALRKLYRKMQMVFQNPVDSFNPRRTLGSSIVDGAGNAGVSGGEAHRMLPSLLERVGLPPEYADRYPSEVSGGECQRAAIARAIAFKPDLLICDECTSALDVNVQAQIIRLLDRLKGEDGLSLLFICHDLSIIGELCERVAVMLRGSIVEEGATNDVIARPLHPYAQLMVASVFPAGHDEEWTIPAIEERQGGAAGCRFYGRCPHAEKRCGDGVPPLFEVEADEAREGSKPLGPSPAPAKRRVACWLYERADAATGLGC